MSTVVPPRPRRASSVLVWLVLLIGLTALGWRGWQLWQGRLARDQARAAASVQQWQDLQARVDALRRDQRVQAQRLQQADATNRVLREELLGVDQRAALLEDSVRQLADPQHHGVQALRIDEAGLLLGIGEQRLRLAGDLDGARRAYALAAGVLANVDSTRLDAAGWLNARQALVQERAALDALGADPRALAAARLDAFAAQLARTPVPVRPAATHAPWWQRAFARLVTVAPADRVLSTSGADRAAADAALQLELTLARAAMERRDTAAYAAALTRVELWMRRLWPDSPDLRRRLAALQALRRLPLTLDLPTLGSTRQQLQALALRR